jgi:hypothetical protein
VFPGKTRTWESQINMADLFHGIYFAKVDVSSGNGIITTKKAYFIGFPVSRIILISVLIAISVILFKRRKKIKKALSILITGK